MQPQTIENEPSQTARGKKRKRPRGKPGINPRGETPAAIAPYRWQPGQTGNPNGSKGLYGKVMSLAREYTPRAMGHLVDIVEDTVNDPRVRTVAIGMILERAWGKPKEIQDDKDKPALDLSRLKATDLQALRGIAARLRGGEATQDGPVAAPEAPHSDVEAISVDLPPE